MASSVTLEIKRLGVLMFITMLDELFILCSDRCLLSWCGICHLAVGFGSLWSRQPKATLRIFYVFWNLGGSYVGSLLDSIGQY